MERLFPPSGGVSRGSVRVGVVKTFLLPSYGFSFGYKRKGVSIAPLTEVRRKNLCTARERPRLPLRRELSSLSAFKGLTEGEITRGCCLHRGADEHGAKKRSFDFTLAYIKCFRTYSVYLSLRLPAQILYAGIHLPPQREARALPRRAQI